MRKEPSELTDHLGYWLRRLSNEVSRTFAERLAAHEVSVPQWVILRILHGHAGMPLKEIVTEVGVDQGAVSRMIERMLTRGWVERRTDAKDRRAVAIALTKEGARLVPILAREADANDRQFFAVLSKAEKRALRGLVERLLPAEAGKHPID